MKQTIDTFKALSDETRIRMLVLLYESELCVCELTSILDISQPNISKHLSKLRKFHLIHSEKVDQFVFYRFNDANMFADTIVSNLVDSRLSDVTLKQDYEKISSMGLYKRKDKQNIVCCSCKS